jgi:hypothetical protein
MSTPTVPDVENEAIPVEQDTADTRAEENVPQRRTSPFAEQRLEPWARPLAELREVLEPHSQAPPSSPADSITARRRSEGEER